MPSSHRPAALAKPGWADAATHSGDVSGSGGRVPNGIAYIAARNPSAAERIVAKMRGLRERLADFPENGVRGEILGTRRMMLRPFVLTLRPGEDGMEIVAARHWSRKDAHAPSELIDDDHHEVESRLVQKDNSTNLRFARQALFSSRLERGDDERRALLGQHGPPRLLPTIGLRLRRIVWIEQELGVLHWRVLQPRALEGVLRASSSRSPRTAKQLDRPAHTAA